MSNLQRAQVVRNVAELANHGGVPDVARRGIAAAAEGDGADVARFARKRLGFHHGGGPYAAEVFSEDRRSVRYMKKRN
jgi:hypothetical protein